MSTCKVCSWSTTHEIAPFIEPNTHYCIHLPLDPILYQMNPVHTFPQNLLKLHFKITLPFTSGSSMWSIPFQPLGPNSVWLSHPYHTCYKIFPFHAPIILRVSSVNSMNTRNKYHFPRPTVNLSSFQKTARYTGITTVYSLPWKHTNLKNEKAPLQLILRKYLHAHTPFILLRN